jgi:peptidoglycan hydrolase-like protein with peptidoglycan-binding domain
MCYYEKMNKLYTISSVLFVALFLIASFVPFSVSAVTSQFSIYLKYNSPQASEVSKLQDFLIKQKFLKGSADGKYGTLTQKAVQSFQASYHIKNGAGDFNRATRAKANEIFTKISQAKVTANIQALGVTSPSLLGASAFTDPSVKITWVTTSYPDGVGIDINLIRKINGPTDSYEFVRKIAQNTANTGEAKWIPAKGETGPTMYIELTCSTSHTFYGKCQTSSAPIKA